MTDRDRRTAAEWFTLVSSCVVLGMVVVLIVAQWRGSEHPAAPVAIVADPVRELDDRYYVDVMVTNHGDDTAANVQVNASLEVEGSTTEGDQTVDFLAGNEEVRLTFVFDDDPRRGELTIAVTGFADP
jgi:uncharacterized protein (TIGR02588 family)